MPTQGTFRSSPWALTWPTKSTNTSPPVAWFHQSEKSRMNAEFRIILTSVGSSKAGQRRRSRRGCSQTDAFSSLIKLGLDRIPDWKGPLFVYTCQCFFPASNIVQLINVSIEMYIMTIKYGLYSPSPLALLEIILRVDKKKRRVLPVILCNSSLLHVARLWIGLLLDEAINYHLPKVHAETSHQTSWVPRHVSVSVLFALKLSFFWQKCWKHDPSAPPSPVKCLSGVGQGRREGAASVAH